MSMRLPAKNNNAEKKLALLGACCLLFSAIDYMIPRPLPFFRLGLANVPVMLALDLFSPAPFFILICIKVLGQALITGTLFSYVFLFSMAGTFFSAFLMYFLRRSLGSNRISFIGISAAGALVSNVSQLALAWFFLFKDSVVYIAPPFLTIGLITGIVLGVFCEIFTKRSKWCNVQTDVTVNETEQGSSITENKSSVPSIDNIEKANKRSLLYENLFSARDLFITGLLILPALVFNPSLLSRILQFLFFWFLVVLSGKKTQLLSKIMIIGGIVIFNLIIPYGRILFSMGPLRITSGALAAGVHRAITFQGLFMISKISIRQDLVMPGSFGKLLSESLRMFSFMMNRKYRISKKIFENNFFKEIDKLMLDLSSNIQPVPVLFQQKTTLLGYVILLLVIACSWLLWLV